MEGPLRRPRTLVTACMAFALGSLAAQKPMAPPVETLTGRVVDEGGVPLAGVAVGYFDPGDAFDTKALLQHPPCSTGDDGRFELSIAGRPWSGTLLIAAKDRQACAAVLRDVYAGGRFGDVVLVPGAQLVGRVRDADGNGVAGARVEVESAFRDQVLPVSMRSATATDARGIFVVPCVPRCGLSLTITCRGYLGLTRLAAQETPLDVTLAKAEVARGRVVDDDGAPVAGARIQLSVVGTTPPAPDTQSDADGRFAIEVPPDVPYRIRAYGPGPHGRFHSELLRGEHDDVAVAPTAASDRKVHLIVRDRDSGETLERVHVAELNMAPTNPQTALFHVQDKGKPCPGESDVALGPHAQGLLITADGHGFELSSLPDDGQPLTVDMGPEAVLTGVVIDAETKQPMAGVHVRALPKGNSSGSGGNVEGRWPATDENGRYRLEGLQPGEYGVQAHASDRTASDPEYATLVVGAASELDLTVPARNWLDVDVTGLLPAGPAPELRIGSHSGGGRGSFQHHVPPPPPLAVRGPGKLRFGPVAWRSCELVLVVPSRVRAASGAAIALGSGKAFTVELAALRPPLVTGRIDVDGDLPSERIAVVATAVGDRRSRGPGSETVAGVTGAGTFAIDLPAGRYRLALRDLVSGLVFHSEPDEFEPGVKPLVLRPRLRWLEVRLEPEREGGAVALNYVNVNPPASEDLGVLGGRPHGGSIPFRPGETIVRCLVPEGETKVSASRSFAMLARDAGSYRYETIAETMVTVDRAEQTVTLRIPALPPDEELAR